jgi:hypothetical protein
MIMQNQPHSRPLKTKKLGNGAVTEVAIKRRASRVQNSPQNKLALCPPALNRPCRPPGMQIVDSRRKVSTTLVSFPLVAPLQSDTRYMPSKMRSARHLHTTSSLADKKKREIPRFCRSGLWTPQDPSLHRVHAITQTWHGPLHTSNNSEPPHEPS